MCYSGPLTVVTVTLALLVVTLVGTGEVGLMEYEVEQNSMIVLETEV